MRAASGPKTKGNRDVLTSSPNRQIDWFAHTRLNGGSSTSRTSGADALLRTTSGDVSFKRSCSGITFVAWPTPRETHKGQEPSLEAGADCGGFSCKKGSGTTARTNGAWYGALSEMLTAQRRCVK